MMGNAPPHVLDVFKKGRGTHVLDILKKPNAPDIRDILKRVKLPPVEMSFGTRVGRALVLGGHAPAIIELAYGDKLSGRPEDVEKRRNIRTVKRVIRDVGLGGRLTRDLIDASDRRQPSAEVGNFKITPSSPNTARVTIGPDRRERRKKYEWEKESFKHKARVLAIGVGAPLLVGAHIKAYKRGLAYAAEKGVKSSFPAGRGVVEYAKDTGRLAKQIAQRIYKGTPIQGRGGEAAGPSVTERALAGLTQRQTAATGAAEKPTIKLTPEQEEALKDKTRKIIGG